MRPLAAKHLLKAECGHIELVPRQMHGKTGRGGVGNRQTRTIRRNPVAMRHPYPRRGAIPCKDDIIVKIETSLPGIVCDLEAAQEKMLESRRLQEQASREIRDIVSRLRSQGLSMRDIGVLLQISPQRVAQLTESV